MPPSLLHYRPWQGELGGSLRLVWPIARVSLAMILRRKAFWVVYALSLLIFFMFFFGQYLLAWADGQTAEATVPVFGVPLETKKIIEVLQKALRLDGSAVTYRNFISLQGNVVMIVLAMTGSILVGNDFRFGSLPFYLSKPLSRWHYLLGKCLAVGVFVNMVTTLPALILFVQRGMLDERWDYFHGGGTTLDLRFVSVTLPVNPLLFGILGYGLVLTVCLSIMLVAAAVWLRKTVPLIMAWTTLFVFLPRLTKSLVDGLRCSPRWRLVDLWHDLFLIGSQCLGMPADPARGGTQSPGAALNLESAVAAIFRGEWPFIPGGPAEAALVLGATCLLCLTYLILRIRAVEVVR